jgi:hypothetical protein
MKKQKLYSIFFHIPLYGVDVMVMVGAKTKKDVLSLMKKQRVRKETVNFWMNHEHLTWLFKQDAGSFVRDNELEVIYCFKDWKDDSKHIEILVHEVSHMVDSIAEHKNLVKETEARAFLSEYIFKTIRNSL